MFGIIFGMRCEEKFRRGGLINGYNLNLLNLEISDGVLSPAFNQSVTGYNVDLPDTITSVTIKSYYIEVVRLPDKSKNTFLAGLDLSIGTLSPSFAKGVTTYSAEISSGTTGMTVTPTAAGINAVITINGTTVASGSASLSSDVNISTLTTDKGTFTPVTATTGTLVIKSYPYRLTIYLEGANASVTINGVAGVSGTATAPLTANTATVVVTAEDGTTKTYTLNVTIDLTPPTPGTLTVIADRNFAALSWTAASDNLSLAGNLEYAIYSSTSNNISTVAQAAVNGTLIKAFATGMTSFSVGGLAVSTQYYFTLMVMDEAGNKSVYTTVSIATKTSFGAVSFNGEVKTACVDGTGSTAYVGGNFL